MRRIFKKRIVVPIVALLVLLGVTSFKKDFFEIAKQIEIFTTLFKVVNMNYVDDTNPGELMDTAITSMLKDLDPYTRFYNEQNVEQAKINRAGSYSGIGAKIFKKDGRLFIAEPYENYPADVAGLKAGDEIIQIDDVKIKDFKENATDLLKGAANTEVKVIYLRQGKEVTTKITRDKVAIDAVPFFELINNKTGYIVLQKFNKKAFQQTKDAFLTLKEEGATEIILDLRGNPGGLLRESVNIVNMFVPKGESIVTTKSKIKKYNKTYKTKSDPLDLEIPIVVLVNGRSASASEIVSGSLQDLDRAVIIGSRSFGKGLVQQYKKLVYGTQVKVTISRYYTPSGRCIQALDYWNRDEDNKAVRTKEKDYNKYTTRNGRPVFDGGGVNPDIEVSSNKQGAITKALLKERLLFSFCTDYYYKHNFEKLSDFKFTDADYNNFTSYVLASKLDFETPTDKSIAKLAKIAETDKIDLSVQIKQLKLKLKQAKKEVLTTDKEVLKELIAKELVTRYFYKKGLYDYQLEHDKAIQEALDVLATKRYKKILKK